MTRRKRPTHTEDGLEIFEDDHGWYVKDEAGQPVLYLELKPAAEADFYRRMGSVVAFTRRTA